MRFRKSIKICKGVKINFSKTGASATLGIPGLSCNVGKNGAYLNTGIPGTGLYDRKKIGGSSPNRSKSQTTFESMPTQIKLALSEDGNISIYDINDNLIEDATILRKLKKLPAFKEGRIELMENAKNKIDADGNEFINISELSATVNTLAMFNDTLEKLTLQKYEKESFDKKCPEKDNIYKQLYCEAKQQIKSLAFWTLKRKYNNYAAEHVDIGYKVAYEKWLVEKNEFEEMQKKLEVERNKEYENRFNLQKKSIEASIRGDVDYIENAINDWVSTISLPVDFNVQFEYYNDGGTLVVDLDLPEIEDMPKEKATQLASGTVKIKNKTQNELKTDYIKCIFGLAIFFASNLYNISPAIENIIISGYTQRRNNKTGEIQDDYVYSIKFIRSKLEKENLSTVDAFEYCLSFVNRCNVNQTKSLKKILPIEIESKI